MNSPFNNPWFDAMLEQMWIVRHATETAAKCIDAELLADPEALTDYCLEPTEERLNPLEFHGKRRPRASNPVRRAGPRGAADRSAS